MDDIISRQPTISKIEKVGDTISRQAAIYIASGYCHPANIAQELAKLPPAQPEIIRCKDCRYYSEEEHECLDLMGHGRRWEPSDWCSYAERKET